MSEKIENKEKAIKVIDNPDKKKKVKFSSHYQYGNLDLETAMYMLYDPDKKQGWKNPHAPIDRLMEARGHSRQQVLIDENLSPPPIYPNGRWMTIGAQVESDFNNPEMKLSSKACAYWDNFNGLPPMFGQFGPRRGRKQRMREAIAKL